MIGPRRIGVLEVGEDLAFQRRSWVIQRIGWAIMAVLTAASIGGVFGSGPLNDAQASSAGGDLRVHYDRFPRYDAPARLRIEAARGLAREGIVWISLRREFVDAIKVRQVMPPPQRVEAGFDWVAFAFPIHAGGPITVSVDYEPRRLGALRVRVGVGDASTVDFGQFVYP
jgi:hypothetical protein